MHYRGGDGRIYIHPATAPQSICPQLIDSLHELLDDEDDPVSVNFYVDMLWLYN